MDKLFGYIVHRAPFLIMYAIAMLMCLLIPYFAGVDMDLAAYTAELITFFFVCVLIVDIKRYHKKMRMLDEIRAKRDEIYAVARAHKVAFTELHP